jgi:hypothetical protein
MTRLRRSRRKKTLPPIERMFKQAEALEIIRPQTLIDEKGRFSRGIHSDATDLQITHTKINYMLRIRKHLKTARQKYQGPALTPTAKRRLRFIKKSLVRIRKEEGKKELQKLQFTKFFYKRYKTVGGLADNLIKQIDTVLLNTRHLRK